jgi:hypothetical protein
MPSSIARLITADHERLLRLLHRALAPGPNQHRWRAEVARLWQAHRAAERDALGDDTLTPAGPDAQSAAAALPGLDPGLEEAMGVLTDPQAPPAAVDRAGEQLRECLAQHAALSKRVLEPLEHAVPRKQIRLLGGRYDELREVALREHGAAEPPPRRFDLPRAELYELARKAGIEGRSQMSRAELIQELMRRQDA